MSVQEFEHQLKKNEPGLRPSVEINGNVWCVIVCTQSFFYRDCSEPGLSNLTCVKYAEMVW